MRSGCLGLLAAGLTTVLALQTLVIVGGLVRLLPLTGVTLPFVSFGGTSLVTNFILIGILMGVSATGVRTVPVQSRSRTRFSWAMVAGRSSGTASRKSLSAVV